jgi:hypothetical protein
MFAFACILHYVYFSVTSVTSFTSAVYKLFVQLHMLLLVTCAMHNVSYLLIHGPVAIGYAEEEGCSAIGQSCVSVEILSSYILQFVKIRAY